jgi:hypothetical protein
VDYPRQVNPLIIPQYLFRLWRDWVLGFKGANHEQVKLGKFFP